MISKKFYTNSKKKINKGIVSHMIANIFNKEQNDISKRIWLVYFLPISSIVL